MVPRGALAHVAGWHCGGTAGRQSCTPPPPPPTTTTQVVYTHCFNFPKKIIFFLLGRFKVSWDATAPHLRLVTPVACRRWQARTHA